MFRLTHDARRQPDERFGLAEILVNGWVTRGGLEECKQPAGVVLGSMHGELQDEMD